MVRYFWKGLPIKKYKSFYENDRIDTIFFYNKNNEIHGYKKSFHENGNLKLISYYEDGVLDGDVHEYFDNGVLKSYKKVSDKKYISQICKYYDNGGIMESYYLNENGKKEHSKKLFDKFGNSENIISYKDGKRHGPCDIFQKNVVSLKLYYQNNKLNQFQYKLNQKGFHMKTIYMIHNYAIVKKETKKKDSCCVCYDTSTWFTICNHCICLSCVKTYFNSENEFKCPYCRTPFQKYSAKTIPNLLENF